MTVIKFVVLVLATKQLVEANLKTPCQTPNFEPGVCIPLHQCTVLSSFFNKGPLSNRSLSFLQRSHCGFTQNEPKVCCATVDDTPPPNFIATSNLLPESCGAFVSDKIVGGEKTALDEFPWMAILKFRDSDTGEETWECGGSLINNRYVLTAAHCLLSSLVGVRLGEYNTETDPDCVREAFGLDCAPKAIDFGIEEKIVYNSYNKKDHSHYHDIGLIRLDKEVQFSDFIKPICLPLTTEELYKTYVGQKLTVSGWGVTEKEKQSSIKLKVQVPVRDHDECITNLKKISSRISLDAGQLCAGGVKGKDSCRADSGGPLMAIKKEKRGEPRFNVVGVVSFGPTPCGKENLPAVYTKVAKYVTWIVDNLKP